MQYRVLGIYIWVIISTNAPPVSVSGHWQQWLTSLFYSSTFSFNNLTSPSLFSARLSLHRDLQHFLSSECRHHGVQMDDHCASILSVQLYHAECPHLLRPLMCLCVRKNSHSAFKVFIISQIYWACKWQYSSSNPLTWLSFIGFM